MHCWVGERSGLLGGTGLCCLLGRRGGNVLAQRFTSISIYFMHLLLGGWEREVINIKQAISQVPEAVGRSGLVRSIGLYPKWFGCQVNVSVRTFGW